MQAVGSALSGLESGIGSAASGLYNMLPSLSALSGGPSGPAAAGIPTVTGTAPSVMPPMSTVTGDATPLTPSGTPAAPSMPQPSLLGAVAQAMEMYQRYNMQQNLQNPNYVAGQIAKLQKPLSNQLVSGITKQVEGQAMERGLGGAPGLFQSALAEALAPYTFAEQGQATQEYFNALNTSNAEYPAGGGYGDFSRELNAGASAFGF
jgi:hypothetical protein